MSLVHLTDKIFDQEVKQSELIVIVDFFSDWCVPCQTMGRIIEKLAISYANKCKICKANIDKTQKKSAELGIMTIPTILIFKNGKVIDKMIGLISKKKLVENIDKYLI